MDIIKSKNILVISTSLFGILLAAPALAANNCKGMIQAECENKTSCRWIDSYTRKDGKTINAYCRSNPKSKPVAKKVPEKKMIEKAGSNKTAS